MTKRRRPPCDVTPLANACTVSAEAFQLVTGVDPEAASVPAVPTIEEEVLRSRAFDALRAKLLKECGAGLAGGTTRYPSMAFERWWFSAQHGGRSIKDRGCSDPLLPGAARKDDSTLLADLRQVGFSEADAQRIAKNLSTAAAAAATTLSGRRPRASRGVVTVEHTPSSDVELRSARANVLLKARAFEKLRTLYRQKCGAKFEEAAFVVALRYQSLGGSGFHLALPTSAFEVLASEFGVLAECFASPLNCWQPRYCSAFPDCDVPFGSLGSFFDFHPRRGAFEVNPPFAPSVLARTRLHIHELLTATTDALSFVVTVAHWDHEEVKAFRGSPFARGCLVVSREDQCWQDGGSVRRAPVELLVVVLQTHAASLDERFAVTDAKLEALRFSCTGDAVPLGPRKKVRRGDPEETESVHCCASVSGDFATEVHTQAGSSPCPRPPFWRLSKLKHLQHWLQVRHASDALAWTQTVEEGDRKSVV